MGKAEGDGRSTVLILLALAPIIGVLGLALVWVNNANEQVQALDREIESVRVVSNLDANRHALAGALHSFQIASLPDAPPAIVAVAEQVQEQMGLSEPQGDQLGGLLEDVTGEAASTSAANTGPFRDAVIAAVEAHQVGSDVGDSLIGIEDAVTVGLMSGAVPALFVQLEQLGPATNRLRALITLSVDYDADLRTVLSAQQTGESIALESLLTTRPLRSMQWDPEIGTWTFVVLTFDAGTPAAIEQGSLIDGPITDAFRALEQSATSAERQAALTQLVAVDRQIVDAVMQAVDDVESQYQSERAELVRERWIDIAVLSGMFIVGLALLLMSRLELQRRRVVEVAHGRALAEVAEKAYRDQLTGLRNRRWLDESLPAQIDGLAPHERVSLVYLDLDGFKSVNDVWGHDQGDEVLKSVGACLRRWAIEHEGWEFVRFGGDEFVGVLPRMISPRSGVIDGLLNALATITTPNERGGAPLTVRVSAGVANGDGDTRAADLILRADSALSQAKQSGGGTAHFYDHTVSRTGELLPLLPAALGGDEVRVHLQPIIDLQLGKIAHVEALARWFRDDVLVSPADFVPLAETYGLADRLTAAVVRDVGRVRSAKPLLPRVWINVSPVELTLQDFALRFLDHLRVGGLDPELVGIEVTESAAIRNVDQVVHVLGTIRQAGVMIAIDDFGAGYTPLGHLRALPIDIIKIDRDLISHVDQDLVNQEIVRGLFKTARRIGCDVVAEGVERIEELAWLDAMGIRYVQGYLLGRPASPEELPLSVPSALQTTQRDGPSAVRTARSTGA